MAKKRKRNPDNARPRSFSLADGEVAILDQIMSENQMPSRSATVRFLVFAWQEAESLFKEFANEALNDDPLIFIRDTYESPDPEEEVIEVDIVDSYIDSKIKFEDL